VAGLFLWIAVRQGQIAWLHTAMIVLALALPYLGCVLMEQRTLHHNTMAFGLGVLSWLWLIADWVAPVSLLRQARLDGALLLLRAGRGCDAVARRPWRHSARSEMVSRLFRVSRTVPHDGGAGVRDLLLALPPAGAMGVAINVILFPELARQPREVPLPAWPGQRLGQRHRGLGLVALCFRSASLATAGRFG